MNHILNELKEHAPYTAIATILAIISTLILNLFITYHSTESVFESLHLLHILFSAFATTTVFYKLRKSVKLAILIGLSGSILIGSLSDIFFPYLGTLIFGLKSHIHLPLIEKPILVLFFSFIGIYLGLLFKKTKIPHISHVFISVFASLFYLTSFSSIISFTDHIIASLIVFLSVLIPCCLSDIIYPSLFNKRIN